MAENGRSKRGDAFLIPVLVTGKSVREASQETGLSERSIYRRLADPLFRKQLSVARTALVDRALGKLSDACSEAAATLHALLTAQGENVRLGAAKAILEITPKVREWIELENRVTVLEQRMEQTRYATP